MEEICSWIHCGIQIANRHIRLHSLRAAETIQFTAMYRVVIAPQHDWWKWMGHNGYYMA